MKDSKKNLHRGEILQIAAKKSRLSIKLITERAGYDRSSYYKHIAEPELPFITLERYGKAIGVDFTEYFPEMVKYISLESDPDERLREDFTYSVTFEQMIKQRNQWRDKYYLLLEKYNVLIEEKLYNK